MVKPRSTGLFLVRHPESVFNAESKWAGCIDSELSPKGLQALPRAVEFWKDYNLSSVTSSTLRRCVTPADFIAKGLKLPLLPPNPDLNERCAGDWEGRFISDIESDPVFTRWRFSEEVTPPSGELYDDFSKRVISGVLRLVNTTSSMLVVTHTGVLNLLCLKFSIQGTYFTPLVEGVYVTLRESKCKTGRNVKGFPDMHVSVFTTNTKTFR